MEKLSFYSDGSKRVDVFLSDETGETRSRIKTLIDDGLVKCGDRTIGKCGEKVKGQVEVTVLESTAVSAEAENLELDIVYQDEDIAVINKAQGMVTHPCTGTPSGTLVNAAVYHIKDLSEINGVTRPGIVHRLDKDTSGLLVIAKNNAAHLSLSKQIESKEAGRFYRALVTGNIKEDEGVIDKAIARSVRDRKTMTTDDSGRRAVTRFRVLERFGDYTYMEFKLETGRTHQIRVHAKYIKHPVVGDLIYGKKDNFGLKGQLLHACRLILTHPTSGERMEFTAPLPDYFERVLEKLRKDAN